MNLDAKAANINFAPKKTAREESSHIVGIC